MGLERFGGITKEEKSNLTFDDFTVSELRVIIDETVLSSENKKIAELRFIKALTVEKIAEKMNFEKRTISTRISDIKKKLQKTINKMI